MKDVRNLKSLLVADWKKKEERFDDEEKLLNMFLQLKRIENAAVIWQAPHQMQPANSFEGGCV